jgi:hypothetical protein
MAKSRKQSMKRPKRKQSMKRPKRKQSMKRPKRKQSMKRPKRKQTMRKRRGIKAFGSEVCQDGRYVCKLCSGQDDIITLDNISPNDTPMCIDKQCYSLSSLSRSVNANQQVPHNRNPLTQMQLQSILNNGEMCREPEPEPEPRIRSMSVRNIRSRNGARKGMRTKYSANKRAEQLRKYYERQ